MICRKCSKLIRPCGCEEGCIFEGYAHVTNKSHFCDWPKIPYSAATRLARVAEPDPEFSTT